MKLREKGGPPVWVPSNLEGRFGLFNYCKSGYKRSRYQYLFKRREELSGMVLLAKIETSRIAWFIDLMWSFL